jgi:hypothetical protein
MGHPGWAGPTAYALLTRTVTPLTSKCLRGRRVEVLVPAFLGWRRDTI